MSDLNIPLNELATTEGMDFSYRGTPLAPSLPEHYTNKQYIDDTLTDLEVRQPAAIPVTCDGTATTYMVTHNLGTTNIASVQVFDTTDDVKNPISLAWEPGTANTITLKPDVLLPDTMTLLVVINA